MAHSKVLAISVESFDVVAITANFQLLSGASGIPESIFLIRIVNNSNIPVIISYDGVNNHDVIRAASELQIPFQSNNSPNGYIAHLAKFTKVYIKEVTAAVGAGSVYLCGYYQDK